LKSKTKPKKEELFCPIAEASKIVGDFWNLLILRELLDGCKRFNQIQEKISDITNSTLSDRLKKLAEQGIVQRKQYQSIPPKVEYTLTEKGMALKKVVNSISNFGENWLSK
jgi:DNA-binding HxlR family transcriptional regulator